MKTLLIIRTILYSYGLPGTMFDGVACFFPPSAFDSVKSKYGKSVMNVDKKKKDEKEEK